MSGSRANYFQHDSLGGKALHSVVVFIVLMSAYLWSMPSHITLEDAGLFQMVCRYGGLAHPPGYPLFTLICPGFSKLSYLDPVISGNLISAFFASLAGVTVFNIVSLIMKQVTTAYLAALCLGFSTAFWSQAIIIEVYSLNVFLFCLLTLLLYCYTKSVQVRLFSGFVLVYGLALSNHWPLIVLSTPAFIMLLAPAYKELFAALKVTRNWFVWGALFIAGLLPYMSILLKPGPFISLYGEVNDVAGLITYVSRSVYADGTATADWQDKFQYMSWLCTEIARQFGWLADVLIVIGVVHARKYLSNSRNLGLWLAFIGNSFFLMLFVNFDFSYKYQAIFKPYPLISYTVMSIWLAFGFKWTVDFFAGFSPILKTAGMQLALGLLVMLSVVVQNYPLDDRHDDRLAENYAELILSMVKPDSNVFVDGDNEIGPVGFLHHVRGMRPDISLYAVRNVVFNNALSSPLVSRSTQNQRMLAFLDETGSNSYFLSPAIDRRGVDYGLFIEYGAGKKDTEHQEYAFDEKISRFLEDILSLYEQQRFTDSHSLIFVHHLLMRFSHQYIGYAFEHDPSTPLDATFLNRIERLQNTFPGKLVTLDYVLHNDSAQVPKSLLLEMVAAADVSIPIETSVTNQVIFYELAGHVALLDSEQYPPDRAAAQHYFRKSLELNPAPDNASLCQLVRINVMLGRTEQLQELKLAYPGAFENCIKTKASESL